MTDSDANRLDMFRTVLRLLDRPEHVLVWKDQPPTIFTERATRLRALLADVDALVSRIAAERTGIAVLKEREEGELETAACEAGDLLSEYFLDQGRVDAAAEVDFPLSSWQGLRDESLLARSRVLLDRLQAALATDAKGLEPYSVTPETAKRLEKEFKDYEAMVSAPHEARTSCVAMNRELHEKIRGIMVHLSRMDKLVGSFGRTPAGSAFAAAWWEARAIEDRGHGPSAPEPQPSPAPPSPPA